MTTYDLQRKFAIVTGGGSGINHALTEFLLGSGCSVMIADLALRPEAEQTAAKYAENESASPVAVFQKMDLRDRSQTASMREAALNIFGQVDVLVSGDGIYEHPSSTFRNAPGVSPLAEGSATCSPGVCKTFPVDTMAPIRLAQTAIDFWLEHREVQGNLLWFSILGG